MQGLCCDWIPYEASDILDFPPLNFPLSSDLFSRHPNENVIHGGFSGLPANCSVNLQLIINVELVPDMSQVGVGLFGLITEMTKERVSPLEVLSEVYYERGNFASALDSAGNSV